MASWIVEELSVVARIVIIYKHKAQTPTLSILLGNEAHAVNRCASFHPTAQAATGSIHE